jgi:acetate kinase
MLTLVINSGSSSLKASLFEGKKEPKLLAKALVDGIGEEKCKLTFSSPNKDLGISQKVKNHEEGLKLVLENLKKYEVIAKNTDINAIGHRVVHGGEKYSAPTKIDAKVIKEIERLSYLAPLHNPVNLQTIKATKKIFSKAKQIAVFDTAFHQTMPEKAYLYALPYEMYEKEGVRRYGFHGTSHQFVVNQALKLLKKLPKTKQPKEAKIVSCHLGNGSSITASINGKSVDTSMGMTPLEGIPMGTRCGSIDPAIFTHLGKTRKIAKVDEILNKESGLKGLSQISSDMRDIYQAAKKGDKQAELTIEHLCYQIAKYIGAYTAAMQGIDALIFTGGMGEKATYIREKVCAYLSYLNLQLDPKLNKAHEEELSGKKSKVAIYLIPTNEGKQIAIETLKAL